jgi:glycosyltransferase involved in cell wall biosynthesis
VLRFHPEPSETFIRREIRGLMAVGVPVTVLAIERTSGAGGEAAGGESRGPMPRVRFLREARGDAPAGRTAVRGAARRLLVQVLRDGVGLGLKPRAWGRCTRLAIDALRGRHYVPSTACRLHAHFANDAAALARYLSILCGVPYVVTAHAYDIYQDPFLLGPNLAAAARVYTVARANLRFLLSRPEAARWDEKRFAVLHCGVDLARFAYRDPPLPRKPARLVCAARLVPKKGHAVLLDAVASLAASGAEVRLTLAGDGPLAGPLRERAAAAGIATAVDFLGTVDSERVASLVRDSDLVVLAARVAEDGDRDGLPVALIEAAALGVPVVSTDVSGIPELVDAETGWLVPPDRPDRFAEAVRAALQEPHSARERRARLARRRVEEEFDLARQIETLRQLGSGFRFQE